MYACCLDFSVRLRCSKLPRVEAPEGYTCYVASIAIITNSYYY